MAERSRQLIILSIGICLNDFASIEFTTFRKQESILGIAKKWWIYARVRLMRAQLIFMVSSEQIPLIYFA